MPIIVSRHRGLVQWLEEQGITGEIISHISDPKQIRGKIVYGVLPIGLAAEADTVVTVELPKLAPELRGKDLSVEEMKAAGARLRAFRVRRVYYNDYRQENERIEKLAIPQQG